MGKCQSKRKSEYYLQQEETIDLEKTLQSCLNEKDEYKEKYETCNRKYSQLKSQLVKSLRTVKDLQRQLTLSEEDASALFLRYAIETDLNRRLRQSQTKLEKENERLQKSSRNETSFCPSSEVLQRLHKFEQRIFLVECRLRDDL